MELDTQTPMPLLTPDLRERLLANGRLHGFDHLPVVKFFNPVGIGTWLATELAEDGDTCAGLADLGFPELGSFSLEELSSLRLPFGMHIERDIFFAGAFPVSAYAEAARQTGSITAAIRILSHATRARGEGRLMRFRPWPKPEPYRDTSRKRAAFERKQRLECEALPLFAEMIGERQHSVDEEMARRHIWWDEREREQRAQRAARWRKARARLFELPDRLRRTVRDLWRSCPYPADPTYLLDLLHQIAVRRVDPHRPPWVFDGIPTARTTPNPSRFDEAFRQIGHRKIGGGPKTMPADEFLFCGNLGSGILFLRTRVRLNDPHESFYTSSSHRLRDSHVGRAGHRIDLEVRGDCSDAELDLIRRLAQEADTRLVVVRRVVTLTHTNREAAS
jgi:hypothetical protein